MDVVVVVRAVCAPQVELRAVCADRRRIRAVCAFCIFRQVACSVRFYDERVYVQCASSRLLRILFDDFPSQDIHVDDGGDLVRRGYSIAR